MSKSSLSVFVFGLYLAVLGIVLVVAPILPSLSGHYRQQLAKFKNIFAAPPVREAYEVSVQPQGETE